MSTTHPVNIGIIGTGGMGTRHALNLHAHVPSARVAAVYDWDRNKAGQAAAACGGARVFAEAADLINDDGVDAVLIASPDPTHVTYTLASIERKKPVLCEKPLATAGADALRVVEAERAAGRRLVSVGFMRRFDPQHCAVRETVGGGDLGRPILYKGVHRNAELVDGISGESVLISSAGHDIDAARWLLGQEVTGVYVRAVSAHPAWKPATRDMVLLQMEFGGGCLATIEVFISADYGYEVTAEIVAERGTAITLQPDLTLVRARQSRGVSVPTDWLGRFQEAYVAELRDWVHSIQTGSPFSGASAWDGYQAVRITDACIDSLRTGQAVALEA